MTRTIRTVTPRTYHPPQRPRDKGRWVLVYCPLCERFVSEETRHPCEQPPELRDRRLDARKSKQMEAGIRDYD